MQHMRGGETSIPVKRCPSDDQDARNKDSEVRQLVQYACLDVENSRLIVSEVYEFSVFEHEDAADYAVNLRYAEVTMHDEEEGNQHVF